VTSGENNAMGLRNKQEDIRANRVRDAAFGLLGCSRRASGPPLGQIIGPHWAAGFLAVLVWASTPALAGQIGVRVVGGSGEFYNRATNETFVPRGANYVRLGALASPCRNVGLFYHTTFNVGEYDACRADRALGAMQAADYNAVRVFLSHPCLDEPVSDSAEYLANLHHFIQLARNYNIHVMLTIDFTPGPYQAGIPTHPQIENINAFYLVAERIEAEARFWSDLIFSLASEGAPLESVFAYEIRNEQNYLSTAKPLSLSSGFVTTANGGTYDMSSAAEKQDMMDGNLVYFIDSLRAAILKADPTALVSCGFAVFESPLVWRSYWAIADAGLGGSSADFIDVHPYPGVGPGTLAQYVHRFEMGGFSEKPILMGEFGAFSFLYSPETAAQLLQSWQVESCSYGFDGWLLWTWDTDEQTELWNGGSQCGLIERSLAPSNRPDPCQSGSSGGATNLALSRPASASSSLPSNPPSLAVDGLWNTHWGAGNFPPQWIDIDLGSPQTIARVRLVVDQFPDGNTVHTVKGLGPGTGGSYVDITQFQGHTTSLQVLEHQPPAPWEQIQWIRVETSQSPSWVAWREIEVFGTYSPSDGDGDGICDSDDVCPGFDDAIDTDGDGVPDGCDEFPGDDDYADSDGDGIADLCDACPGVDDREPCPPVPALSGLRPMMLFGLLVTIGLLLQFRARQQR